MGPVHGRGKHQSGTHTRHTQPPGGSAITKWKSILRAMPDAKRSERVRPAHTPTTWKRMDNAAPTQMHGMRGPTYRQTKEQEAKSKATISNRETINPDKHIPGGKHTQKPERSEQNEQNGIHSPLETYQHTQCHEKNKGHKHNVFFFLDNIRLDSN